MDGRAEWRLVIMTLVAVKIMMHNIAKNRGMQYRTPPGALRLVAFISIFPHYRLNFRAAFQQWQARPLPPRKPPLLKRKLSGRNSWNW